MTAEEKSSNSIFRFDFDSGLEVPITRGMISKDKAFLIFAAPVTKLPEYRKPMRYIIKIPEKTTMDGIFSIAEAFCLNLPSRSQFMASINCEMLSRNLERGRQHTSSIRLNKYRLWCRPSRGLDNFIFGT
jgi:hypothetical protein